MDPTWQAQFQARMAKFGTHPVAGSLPVSIKVRAVSGCFHREHSPAAYQILDSYLSGIDHSEKGFQVEEHESGPEILVYLPVVTAGLAFAAAVIGLVTQILKARSDGIERGDRPSDPLEVIVRGHWNDGEYFEERILRVSHSDSVTPKLVEDALSLKAPRPPKAKRKTGRK